MLVAAFLSLFNLRVAAIISLIAGALLWSYYGQAFIYTLTNIGLQPSFGMVSLFFLTLTTAYSILAVWALRRTNDLGWSKFIFPPVQSSLSGIAALTVGLVACAFIFQLYKSPEPRRDVFSPSQRSDLIVYFSETATNGEINQFLHTVVGIPRPEEDPSSTELLPEIARIGAWVPIDNHEAYIIDLRSNVSKAKREELKARIWQSPIVYVILEDAIPSQIVKLPTPNR